MKVTLSLDIGDPRGPWNATSEIPDNTMDDTMREFVKALLDDFLHIFFDHETKEDVR